MLHCLHPVVDGEAARVRGHAGWLVCLCLCVVPCCGLCAKLPAAGRSAATRWLDRDRAQHGLGSFEFPFLWQPKFLSTFCTAPALVPRPGISWLDSTLSSMRPWMPLACPLIQPAYTACLACTAFALVWLLLVRQRRRRVQGPGRQPTDPRGWCTRRPSDGVCPPSVLCFLRRCVYFGFCRWKNCDTQWRLAAAVVPACKEVF